MGRLALYHEGERGRPRGGETINSCRGGIMEIPEEEAPGEQAVLPTDIELPERRRRRHSRRPCPRCGQQTLLRQAVPLYLKPLRWAGLHVRRYRCETCGRRAILRKRA